MGPHACGPNGLANICILGHVPPRPPLHRWLLLPRRIWLKPSYQGAKYGYLMVSRCIQHSSNTSSNIGTVNSTIKCWSILLGVAIPHKDKSDKWPYYIGPHTSLQCCWRWSLSDCAIFKWTSSAWCSYAFPSHAHVHRGSDHLEHRLLAAPPSQLFHSSPQLLPTARCGQWLVRNCWMMVQYGSMLH